MIFFIKPAKVLLFLSILILGISANAQNKTLKETTVSIIGTGDIMLGSNYPDETSLPPNDGKDLLKNVKETLKSADVTFGNLEGCILDKGGSVKNCKSGCYFFRMPNNYVNLLTDAGFDVMNIANNHMGDFGQEGRNNTIKVLKEAGLNYAGLKDICETSQFEINGVKYGFCGFAPNSGTVKITDIEYAKKLVAQLDKVCDIVIVSFHGGAEGKNFNRVPKKTETFYGENRGNVYDFAHAVIDAGADVVFGHGPHVVRAAELYKNRFIIYSMGNFCTSGTFSISGISGYAPMVKVNTTKKGEFISGEIISALQLDKTGPIIDTENAAAKEIKRLTELDFPNTDITISEDGKITKKSAKSVGHTKTEDVNKNNTTIESGSNYATKNLVTLQETFSVQDSIINLAKQYLGTRYRRGAKGPENFDCSGFTSYIFKHYGHSLGACCTEQVTEGEKVDKEDLKTGDLIFFKGRSSKATRVGHVGIVVANHGNGNIEFIHASCSKGITIDKLNFSDYYEQRYVTGVRILNDNM